MADYINPWFHRDSLGRLKRSEVLGWIAYQQERCTQRLTQLEEPLKPGYAWSRPTYGGLGQEEIGWGGWGTVWPAISSYLSRFHRHYAALTEDVVADSDFIIVQHGTWRHLYADEVRLSLAGLKDAIDNFEREFKVLPLTTAAP